MKSDFQLYVVGGKQKKANNIQCGSALIALIDSASGTPKILVEYESPPDARPANHEASILFKAGTVEKNILYLCTETEVMSYLLPNFEKLNYLSLPFFNDLHHVRPTSTGTLLVAVSGLDMVVEVSWKGKILKEWDVLGEPLWAKFSKAIDYRKITTKPHRSHPNYIFQYQNHIWATRFYQRDAVCLTGVGRIDLAIEGVHDGVVDSKNETALFTTVDGHIIQVDLRRAKVNRVIDLNEIHRSEEALGWCRSILAIDQNHVLVGFSRIRHTKFVENIRWVAHRFGAIETPESLPTRIALYDIDTLKLCWEQDLEGIGMNAVFSIHFATNSAEE